MVDKVRLLKVENSSNGTQINLGPTEINPQEDYSAVKGISFEESDDHLIDRDGSGNLRFKDTFHSAWKTFKSYTDDILGLQTSKYDASNPNNYETPSQLNDRDTANRARANHTGTQLSNTISDFASTVLSTVLTGISFATGTPVVATDTLLVAFGKLQAQIDTIVTTVTPQSTGTANSAGTSTAMAKADHVHNTVIVSDVVKATGEVQTTSASDTLLTDMTITPQAGTYMVFGYSLSNNISNGQINRFSLYSGGSQVANTLQGVQVSSSRHHAWGASAKVTVNGSQAIEIRWNRASGTARCFGRYLSIIKVG